MDAPTILVIEDNPVTRKMLRVTLESENFRVLEAGDGRTALALLDAHRPDLVLQDLILPDMDGLELVQRLRSRAPDTALPILALSGFLSRLEESRTTEAGFSALLVKPIEPTALIEAISAYLPNARRLRSPANAPHQILVVDDDAVQLKLTRVQLTNLGFGAMAAGSVPEALRLARRSPPHLILSDVFMPGTDGFQLCMEVRRDPALAAVPVVLVSAYYGTREDHDLARRVGATALVMRTPGFPDLERVVRSALASGPPPVSESPHDQITLSHAKAVIRQLEQQLAGLSGLTQRVALQAAQLSLLGGVADALTRKTDIDAALRDVLAATLDAAGISKGALMLLEGDGTLRVRPAIGFSEAELQGLPHFFGHLALLHAIIARGASVTAPSSAIAQEAGEEILRGAGVESMQIVPLIASGVPMGALVIGASRTDVTAYDSVAFARAIGNQIVQTLQLSKSVASLSASEQRYRTLLDRASDAIAVLGTDGVVREVNERWERLLMRRRDEIVGRRVSEFAPPGKADETLTASTADGPADGSATPVELLRANGATVRVELSATRLDVNGERLVLTIGRDVTEQHRLEEQLRQAQKLEAIGQLAGGVAHDFNNLLTAILGFTDLLASSLPPEDPALDDLGEIKKAGERAAALTRQLLAFGRKQILQPTVLDINAVIEGLEPMLRRLLMETVTLQIERDGPPGLVLMDATQIEQILINLAVNASDAMGRRGGTLTIRTAMASIPGGDGVLPPGAYVLLVVTDTGSGMSEEVIAHIFEPFFTTKGPGKGTGLGLATVYGIVKQSGGDIRVRSEPGRGSTFEIFLPRVPVPHADAAGRASRKGEVPSGSETVLIVEDDGAVRRLTRMTLERRGYTVLEASNPKEAEQVAQRHGGRIHLVLSDVIMPESEGPPLIDRLAARQPGLRVLYMSGYADETIVQHGLLVEGTSFVQKPFAPETLLRKVREMLG